MKRFVAVIMMLLMAMSGTMPVFGAIVTNADPWAKASMEFAYNQGLITEENLLDAKREITRLEFCKIVVLLYEKSKGEKLVPKSESPFTDCNNPSVIAAYEAGIISGTEPTKFKPNDNLTREQLAILLNRILKVWGITLTSGTEKYAFSDISILEKPSIEVIGKIKNAGILVGDDDGKFYPMRGLTFQEAVIGLVKICHYAEQKAEPTDGKNETTDENKQPSKEVVEKTPEKTNPSSEVDQKNLNIYETVYINDKAVFLGETTNQLKESWGEPNRIDTTVYALKRYVYINDYESYFFVTLKEDKVVEIFVPTKYFSYLGTNGEGTSANIKQLNYISLVEHSGIVETDTTYASIPLDYEGSIRGILLQERAFTLGNNEKSGLTISERETLETQLLDLIQVKRKEQGLPLLTKAPKLSSVALVHSKDMVDNNYLGYTGTDGSTPFTRILNEKVSFTSASEVIAKQRGDITNVYRQWIRTAAQFQSLLDPTMDSVGVGVSQKGKDLYVTVDFCGGYKDK
ncbi:S-layer homology domain-containing protein [Anaerotignum propionicum]|uniref:Endo-1,4-beta-xylanase A n=1 Tax=Anaerotignum propionicum DSM 1682 TaxID=991789 RepID=A0A0X8VAM1_ANAPI|nr:S-layer homology domain-containing protein [Anaerotignum propionicum]AMJ40443.1 endo-1,4-beta-xylanase A precursor [Anaerotignum propionicum DSM 1682]SHE41925.1 S-layer homology domain-containing protein [[Clostridium] propionicum DSM 1682] [Anaerotignum propionicum DSM 1682]